MTCVAPSAFHIPNEKHNFDFTMICMICLLPIPFHFNLVLSPVPFLKLLSLKRATQKKKQTLSQMSQKEDSSGTVANKTHARPCCMELLLPEQRCYSSRCDDTPALHALIVAHRSVE